MFLLFLCGSTSAGRRIETHRHIENNRLAHSVPFASLRIEVVGDAALNTNNGNI
jgi:hypothetical protein